MKKWVIEGTIKANIPFREIVEAVTQDSAVKKAEKIVYSRCNITEYDVLDDEIYAETVEEWGAR